MIRLQSVFIRKRNAQISIPPHNHTLYEFVYYFDGAGQSVLNNELFDFRQGYYTFTPPYVIHSETFAQTSTSLVILFEMDEDLTYLRKYFCRTDKYVHISPYIDKIVLEYENKFYNYKHMIENNLESLLTDIVRKQHLMTGEKSTNNLSDIRTYFDEYYMTKIDLKEIAQEYGYSANHFRKLFTEACGVPPKEYILKKRLERAEKLLAESDKSIGEIGEICGFGFYSEFALFFKKKTGLTPACYRSESQNGKKIEISIL